MKKKYKIKYISDFDDPSSPDRENKCNLFTICEVLEDNASDEFNKVLINYKAKYKNSIKWALLRIKRMITTRGIQLDQFENESEDGTLPVYKLTETSSLRLYFIIPDNITIIFGGAGKKFVKRWQDDSLLSKIVYGLQYLIKQVDSNEIKITKVNCEEFTFEIDLED